MKRTMLNLLALALITSGGAHLLAQESPADEGDEKQICCRALTGAQCCGNFVCNAGWWSCCTDAACK